MDAFWVMKSCTVKEEQKAIQTDLLFTLDSTQEIYIFQVIAKKKSPNVHTYKARHTHKRLYMVLPKYSKIQVLPGITSCRLMKYNKQAIELNSLLNE